MINPRRTWTFTPDEFAWIWCGTGRDEYPEPIRIRETPTTEDEYLLLRAELSAKFPIDGDPDLIGPLRMLQDPELRVISFGRFHGSPRRVRAVGVAVADLAVVLFQKSGATEDIGGDVVLRVLPRPRLAEHIAATIPPAAAGRVSELVGRTARVRGVEPPQYWGHGPDGKRSVEERMRALLRSPRTAEGFLCIERPSTDRHRQPSRYIHWIDISPDHPAEGRYLVRVDDNDTVIAPATAEVIAREVSRTTGTYR